MNKTNHNATDLKSFGKKSLRIIFSVLEDIKAKMEITQTNKNITVRYSKKVDDVSESERRHALDSLFNRGIIKKTKLPLSFSAFFRNNVDQELAVSVEVDISKFNEFYQEIEKHLTSEEIDIKSYARYILLKGNILEKRELLTCVKSQLVLDK